MQINATAGNSAEAVEAFAYWSGTGTLIVLFFLAITVQTVDDISWTFILDFCDLF